MKKITMSLICVGAILSQGLSTICYAAENEKNAVSTSQEFIVNGEEKDLFSVSIEDNNYMRLRDIAEVVNFGIGFDERTNTVKILPEGDYTSDGNLISNNEIVSATAVKSGQVFVINQEPIEITAYSINDNNFVKLRDVAEFVGFTVDYDEENNNVIIDTKKDNKAGYELVWSDEFDGDKLNEDVWSCEDANRRNQQLQCFTPENVFVEDSNLVIEARKEKKNGSEYTSGGVFSEGKYSFYKGILEVRAKLPKGKGIWTGIWTMGESDVYDADMWKWPRGGEIDIIENVGMGNEIDNSTVYHTVHSAIPGAEKYKHFSEGRPSVLPDGQNFNDDYHLFSLKWTDDYLVWYVDDVEVYKLSTEGQSMFFADNFKQYIRLSFAVGGSWPGDPNEDTVFPARYLIDYVRVYQQGDNSWRAEKKVPVATEILVDGKPVESFEPYAPWCYAVEWTPESKIEAVVDDNCDVTYEFSGDTAIIHLVDKTDARLFTTYYVDCYPFDRALEIQKNNNVNVTVKPIENAADAVKEVTVKVENLKNELQSAYIKLSPDENYTFGKTDLEVNLEAKETKEIKIPININKNTKYHFYTYGYTVKDKDGKLLDSDSGALSFTAITKATKEINVEEFDGDISDWEDAYPIYIQTPNNPTDSAEWDMADCSVRALTKWDDSNIYVLADVYDEVLTQNNTGKRIYNGDCIQIAIDPKNDGSSENGGFRDDDFLIGFSKTSEGIERYAWKSAVDTVSGMTDCAKIIRDDENHLTRYLIKLNKSDLVGFDFKENLAFGLNMSVDDCDLDQDVREECYQFTLGIEDGANPDEYADFILMPSISVKTDGGMGETIFPIDTNTKQ